MISFLIKSEFVYFLIKNIVIKEAGIVEIAIDIGPNKFLKITKKKKNEIKENDEYNICTLK
jgi:hypothetical protein